MELKTKVDKMNRVGETTARRLKSLGIETVLDLLYWFPFRYEDYRSIKKIKELVEGEMATVKVRVEHIGVKRSHRQRRTFAEALVSDESGSMKIVWFNQPFIAKNLSAGQEIYLSGKAKNSIWGIQLSSPAYEKVSAEKTAHTARLVPMYPLTQGITQKQLRFLVSEALPLAEKIPDWQSEEILDKYDFPNLSDALKGIHFPVDDQELKQSSDRLKFDELFLLQARAALGRKEKSSLGAMALTFKEKEIKELVDSLPFVLTKAQKIAAWDILKDTAEPHPMNRLLSGDVGSGKTVVAAIALYNAALNKVQSVLMAPTEILATQHYYSLNKLLSPYNVKIGLFTRGFRKLNFIEGKVSKKEMLKHINLGEVQIMVGTHTLITDVVEFDKLALVAVDEQHRFGVNQRKIIKEKGERAHFLSMTATPIPRSLALMMYGDLSVSPINEMPKGRKKIITRLVEPKNREKAYEFIRKEIKSGRQVFVICSLVEQKEEGEDLVASASYFRAKEKKTVMNEYEKLSKKIFPDLRVGYLHGKLKTQEKEEIMDNFKSQQIDILVATSVVEVGVDIPNATIMMIEDAESFGLAQLHQFRGRVGRGDYQSYCFLFTENETQKSLERLSFFEKEDNGFRLAEKDLEIRGPGEVYGTEQSGMMKLRLAKLTDTEILKKAREAAEMVASDLNKYPVIKKRLEAWEEKVHLE